MNTIGIPYTVAYSVAIALRYIPDVQGDYRRIRNAQQARGIEMSNKAKLSERIKRTSSIIFPLLFSAMEKINIVSNAMELRGFGKKKKRSWYAYRKFQAADYIVLIISGAFCVWARTDHKRRILRVGAVVHLPGRQQVLEPMGVRMIGAVILQQMVLRLDV